MYHLRENSNLLISPIKTDGISHCYQLNQSISTLRVNGDILHCNAKGEFQICPRMDLDNILYVEYLRYNNYKNDILFLERC